MNAEQILLFWNEGHSRRYLYEAELKSLKYKYQNVKRSSKLLYEEAIRNVEEALYNDYMKNLKRRR